MVAELSSLEGLREGFISDASHEIKTPLSVIQGYITLLEDIDVPKEKRNEYIHLISTEIRKLSVLVTNVLKIKFSHLHGIIPFFEVIFNKIPRGMPIKYAKKHEINTIPPVFRTDRNKFDITSITGVSFTRNKMLLFICIYLLIFNTFYVKIFL
jgi:hypothetical protein